MGSGFGFPARQKPVKGLARSFEVKSNYAAAFDCFVVW